MTTNANSSATGGLPVEVLGETFYWEQDEDGFWVTHPKWSTVGRGDSLPEAIHNLCKASVDLAEVYGRHDKSKMTGDAWQMYQWCASIKITYVKDA